ncbi:inositol oxygenase 1 [Podospora conica]|nr:inositol oxygenase 1 [Schizothecium conicum]
MSTAILAPGPALEAISDEIDAHNSEKYSSSPTPFRHYPPTPTSPLLHFYTTQHTLQTYAYNLAARARFHSPARARPRHTIWSALLLLSSLVDASDPDAAALSQLQHSLQTAEALRRDGRPRWMQFVGLVHDLGKLMAFVGGGVTQGGQWDVVGDTFPVGCGFREEMLVYPGTWGGNGDAGDEVYGTRLGVYEEGCGMGGLVMSWGHDEFLYQVLRGLGGRCRVPAVGLGVVRFHSFYGWHREGGYMEFMSEEEGDGEVLEAVRVFNGYDLYTKRDEEVDVEGVRGYWEGVIGEFIEGDGVIEW